MQERHFRAALLVLGHGVFVALLVLAWKHAILRSTYGDTAFQVFQWITQPGWDIEAHRYTAILPQALVKLVALTRPGLSVLLITASLAHVLVGYGIYLLCAHVWKAREAALGCALAAVLCSRLSFYSPVLEANYLLCYPFLLLGYCERCGARGEWRSWSLVFAWLMALATLIVHPMGWMVLTFGIVFQYFLRRLPIKVFLPLLLVTLAWPLISRLLFPPTQYEMEQYKAVSTGFGEFSSFSTWGSWRYLSLHTFSASTTYLPALLTLLAVIAGWCALKVWRIAALSFAGATAFILVFLIAAHTGDSAVMQDRAILPVATIIAIPAAALVMRVPAGRGGDRSRVRPWLLAAVTVILFVKLRDVSFASRPFLRHFDAMGELLARAENQGVRRGIVRCAILREQDIEVTWAFPVETLLRSAIQGPQRSIVLVCDDNLPAPHMLSSGQLQVLHLAWAMDKNGAPYFQELRTPYVPVD